jgi:hypothetical protein
MPAFFLMQNFWLHQNNVIFNGAAPNLQICFFMVRRRIVLWLRLDSSSLELDSENVLIAYDANGTTEGRR